MGRRGVLTVVSGFSGAGKGTLMKALLTRYDYGLSISATTRKPRQGETHGKEYFFLTREEFESMIRQNALIEWAEYVGNYYGTPREYVEKQLDSGRDVILEIEIQGAFHVKEQYPDCLLVFVTPPSAQELKNRLVGRGTEDMETINRRLHRAREEAVYMDHYDYILVNDDLDVCTEQLHEIIQDEEKRKAFAAAEAGNQELIRTITDQLKVF
ncbi:guanylate kinase [Anaerolentibacter hominis]|uniref:guanylate kinase n=1 Tax=Anaerolentibacter hominis TaxID=3079009 RepID=UPI0031B8517B